MSENFSGGFETLEVWKLSRSFRKRISELVKSFPREEKYRLTDQLIRASRGITACLSEGYGRYHFQENIQYCRMARGSLMECLDHLICAHDEKYIDDEQLANFRKNQVEILSKLNGYIAYLKRRKEEG
jgi:four helix bundle protein